MRRAFTLIEFLVVISIIVLLIAILLPMLSSARESARLVQCASNLRQQGMGTLASANDRNGALPKVREAGNPWGLTTNHWSRWFSLSGNRWNLGLIWDDGVLPTGEIFYCPSQEHPAFSWQTYDSGFPTDVQPFPGWSSGIRVSYNHNPMTKTQTDRERRFQNVDDLGNGREAMLGADLIEYQPSSGLSSAHDDLWNVMWGDASVHAVKSNEATDILESSPNVAGNDYANFDKILDLLMEEIDFGWYETP